MNNLIVLVATKPRLSLLAKNALPSINQQISKPKAVVIVSDTRQLKKEEVKRLQLKLNNLPLHVLMNSRALGAAGAWNTGIDYINEHYPESYIAIIDDDNRWHPDHLSSCLAKTKANTVDIVLSGINIKKNGKTVVTNIPNNVSFRDFLVGNPGWQGSNTFIKAEFIKKIGGFTDGLISGNDRDLAIRALKSGLAKISYTNKATVDWICNQSPDALSAPKSVQKLKGSAQFFQLHKNKMSRLEIDAYFQRCHLLFSLSREEIFEELSVLEGKNV